jgi:hypothetical protein
VDGRAAAAGTDYGCLQAQVDHCISPLADYGCLQAKHTLCQQQVEVDSAFTIIFMLFNGHKNNIKK